MRAVTVEQFGRLVLAEVDEPVRENEDVLVQVRAVSVNRGRQLLLGRRQRLVIARALLGGRLGAADAGGPALAVGRRTGGPAGVEARELDVTAPAKSPRSASRAPTDADSEE